MTFFGLEHFSLFLIYLCSSRVLCCLSFCFNNSIWGLRLSISLSLLVDVCLYMKVFLLVISYDGVVNGLDVVIAPFVRKLVILLRCLFCSVLSDDESLYRWRWCFSLLHLCEISWSLFSVAADIWTFFDWGFYFVFFKFGSFCICFNYFVNFGKFPVLFRFC